MYFRHQRTAEKSGGCRSLNEMKWVSYVTATQQWLLVEAETELWGDKGESAKGLW